MSDSITTSDRPPLLDRREFTSAALMALLSGVTVTVIGCGSDSPTSPTNPDGRSGSVQANHGHTAVITNAELSAGNAVTLNIGGTADHPHTVVLTMGEVGQIAAGQRVSKTSSTDGSVAFGTHSHTVVFN
jgi:hypothetical protein